MNGELKFAKILDIQILPTLMINKKTYCITHE